MASTDLLIDGSLENVTPVNNKGGLYYKVTVARLGSNSGGSGGIVCWSVQGSITLKLASACLPLGAKSENTS